MCNRCWSRHPWWLGDFADFAAGSFSMARACVMITALGRLLRDGDPANPQALLERSRQEGRSAGPLARTLEDFLTCHQLAFGLDQAARLAAGRRQRRVDGTPEPLRPTVRLFCEHLVRSRERARRAGTHPRADSTIEGALAIVRDLALFLVDDRAKTDWATAQTGDIEAFLNAQPANRRRRLSTTRQFFGWARRNKLVLVDPTTAVTLSSYRGFTGDTLTVTEQRRLFRRWTHRLDEDVHPYETLVGLLALMHAFTSIELRHIRVEDIDLPGQTIRVDGRPHPVPLDPASLAAIGACLTHRGALRTPNPHLIVTKITKTRSTPASTAYISHILDPAGVNAKTLRSTRLVDLVISLDPKLVAEALGMNAGGLLDYLADHVDPDRLIGSNL